MRTKLYDFSGMIIYACIDVHKKSWSVTLLADEQEHKTFNQPPSADALHTYLKKHFPRGAILQRLLSRVQWVRAK